MMGYLLITYYITGICMYNYAMAPSPMILTVGRRLTSVDLNGDTNSIPNQEFCSGNQNDEKESSRLFS
jgi:hypothetical protein